MDSITEEGGFPYAVVFICITWAFLGIAYSIGRWREKPKQQYMIPRVFVLCSPRTVQFHYELILRVGLPSSDFNPDKHDIDIVVYGQQRNEVVPMTRLNTKTLYDEPLITSLSIIVYRLVEMPRLGTLTIRHSGPFKAHLFAYDFTVIDLSSNKEQYYTINKYVGSLNKSYHLEELSETVSVHYPIDDVPLPPWSLEDIFIIIFTVANCLMLSSSLLPINCTIVSDIASIILTTTNGLAVALLLEWFLHYNLHWSQDRREFFNQTDSLFYGYEYVFRIVFASLGVLIGAVAIFLSTKVNLWQDSLVWLLVTSNAAILAFGLWNIGHSLNLGDKLVALGLGCKGVESVPVGASSGEVANPGIQTKSGGSASDEDGAGSRTSQGSQVVRSIGPRSSVKSFGFDPSASVHKKSHMASLTGYPASSNTPYTQQSLRGLNSSQQRKQTVTVKRQFATVPEGREKSKSDSLERKRDNPATTGVKVQQKMISPGASKREDSTNHKNATQGEEHSS